MVHKRQIQELVPLLHAISYDDDRQLDLFLTRLKDVVEEIFGAHSQYMTCLNVIRFRPSSPLASVEDNIRYWARAKKEMRDLLFVMLDDHSLRSLGHYRQEELSSQFPDEPPSYELESSFSEIVSALKNRVRVDFSRMESPLTVPEGRMPPGLVRVRINLKDMMCIPGDGGDLLPRHFKPQVSSNALKQVFFLPGNNKAMNDDIAGHLTTIGASIVCGETLSFSSPAIHEQVLQCSFLQMAVVVLSEECWTHSRRQGQSVAVPGPSLATSFALGYLLGKLGRDRVVAIYSDGQRFQRPTGYFEVVYIAHNSSGLWKKELAGVLKDVAVNPFHEKIAR
ncbi:MAG: hypothetical protein HQL16_02025 [Candidatus Omnitrophica bacterium]|nr:hypothetical protein [Candidatus Omnitrophota bacterium]